MTPLLPPPTTVSGQIKRRSQLRQRWDKPDRRRLKLPVCAGLATGLIVAGCMVGPDYQTPEAFVAPDWRDAHDPAVISDRQIDRNWWSVFADPTLDALVDLAYRQNPGVLEAGVRVLEARAQLGIAIGDFYPQQQAATGELNYNRVSERAPFTQPASSSLFTYTQASIGMGLSWELDFWGKFRRAVQAADANFLASVAAYDNVLVTLVADVASSYVGIRTLQQRLAIAEENVRLQRESLSIARARFEGGTTSERDVAQAETVLASTEATIPALTQQLRQSTNALSVLLGLPPSPLDALLTGPPTIPVAPAEAAVGLPVDLLDRRPDVRQAMLLAASESARIGFEKAELYPAVSLSGNFGYLASDWGQFDLSDMFTGRARTFAIGPAVQWNILNYGQITNRVRAQDARYQAAIFNFQTVVLTAQREVEDGLAQFLQARLRTEALARAASAAKRSFELSLLQYREGIVDFTTVLTAQQDLLQAQDNLVSSLGDIPQGLILTYRAIGGGWQLREGQDFVPPSVQAVMAERTDWGNLLTPVSLLQPSAPILPGPEDIGRTVRAPEW